MLYLAKNKFYFICKEVLAALVDTLYDNYLKVYN